MCLCCEYRDGVLSNLNYGFTDILGGEFNRMPLVPFFCVPIEHLLHCHFSLRDSALKDDYIKGLGQLILALLQ